MNESNLKVGFSKVDITPPLGVCMAGYYSKRLAEGILDPLYASALSISDLDDNIKVIIISCDLIGLDTEYVNITKKYICERLGLTEEKILIHSTHTHTGPFGRKQKDKEKAERLGGQDEEYIAMLERKIADAAQMASGNLKKVTLKVGYGSEDSISFIRRYRMKDGSIKTNPGIGNTDIIGPNGEKDPTVFTARFKYADGSGEILLVNFALHPDTTSGSYISADYPGHMRSAIKRHIPNCEVVYINGAAGDINHIDAMHPGRTSVGYEYSSKLGNILAAEVLKIYQNLSDISAADAYSNIICSTSKVIKVPLRKINSAQVEQSHEIVQAFYNGEWKAKNMGSTPDLAKAYQTLKIAGLGDSIMMEIQVIVIKGVTFIGLPGEVFSEIGRKIKNKSPFKHTFISSVTNGTLGYFPTRTAFNEGGYESRNNPFTEELEDLLVNTSIELLNSI
ncbi:MAG: neutral/alkaline non-lysosomal ceramidase N-terminal domain-containing protein [Clostridia bacterium]|nr:neutral/alkaline non-lysosomal ceramidase N-terminal domain-containing protein [Clostridia bacterium]